MNEFLFNLSSLSWWLSVVAVGILINLISPSIGKVLGKILIKTSTKFKNKAAERSEKRKIRIEELKADQHKQIMFAFKEQRLRIRSLDETLSGMMLSSLGILMGVIGALLTLTQIPVVGILSVVFSSIFILYGLGKLIISFNDTRKVVEIRNILNEIFPDIADSDIIDWL